MTAAQDWIDRDCSLNASGHPPQDSWGDDDATACGEKVTEVCRLAWRQRADVLLMEEAVRRVGLSELAAVRVRFGYRRADRVIEARRLAGRWERIYRPCGDEGLTVRTEPRKKLASRGGTALASRLLGRRPPWATRLGQRRGSSVAFTLTSLCVFTCTAAVHRACPSLSIHTT